MFDSPLSALRQREMARRAQEGDRRAKETLIVTNRGLVASIAREYSNRGVDFEDLMQEGTLGLMRAVEKFELDKDVKFSTYAGWWIRQAMGRICEQQGTAQRYGYRVPSHVSLAMGRIARQRQELERRLGREATASELAAACEVSLDAAEQALRMEQVCSKAPEEAGIHVIAEQEVGDELEGDERQRTLKALLRDLPEAERNLLTHRYGLDGQEPMSERELGEKWGMERSELQSLRSRALRHIRMNPQVRALHDSDGPLPSFLRQGVAMSIMSQCCGHLAEGADPENLGLELVSRMSERALVGRVAGGWWLVSRPKGSRRWQVLLMKGRNDDLLTPAEAAKTMRGEQLIETAEWVASLPLQQAEACASCAVGGHCNN